MIILHAKDVIQYSEKLNKLIGAEKNIVCQVPSEVDGEWKTLMLTGFSDDKFIIYDENVKIKTVSTIMVENYVMDAITKVDVSTSISKFMSGIFDWILSFIRMLIFPFIWVITTIGNIIKWIFTDIGTFFVTVVVVLFIIVLGAIIYSSVSNGKTPLHILVLNDHDVKIYTLSSPIVIAANSINATKSIILDKCDYNYHCNTVIGDSSLCKFSQGDTLHIQYATSSHGCVTAVRNISGKFIPINELSYTTKSKCDKILSCYPIKR